MAKLNYREINVAGHQRLRNQGRQSLHMIVRVARLDVCFYCRGSITGRNLGNHPHSLPGYVLLSTTVVC